MQKINSASGFRTANRLNDMLFSVPIPPPELSRELNRSCRGCHFGSTAKSGLDFGSLKFDLTDRATRERWIRVHDRVEKGEMPPKGIPWSKDDRAKFLQQLTPRLARADADDVARDGRGAMRRLNRDEYEQNLRDVLQLPLLDIRDMLPEAGTNV